MTSSSNHIKSKIFDSFDPNYPDLPNDLFYTNESDEFSEDDGYEDALAKQSTRQSKREKKLHNQKNRRYTEGAYSSTAARERIKWEPGIDINTTEVILSSLGSAITITDYNEKRYRVERVDVKTEHSSLDDDDDPVIEKGSSTDDASEECAKLERLLKSRPKWSKVRWVNVNGLSWESITILGKFYNLHRLAIEDMVDIPTRTKIDFFPNCLFGVLPLIKLVKSLDDNDNNADHKSDGDRKGSSSWQFWGKTESPKNTNETAFDSTDGNDTEMTINDILSDYYDMRRLNDTFKPIDHSNDYQNRHAKYLNDQKPLSYRNLFVGIEQCSFFILPNGVILTFFESSGDDIESAILSRISKGQTVLRTSCDSSILLQNILDVIVDIVYPVITAYRKRLNEFEVDVLVNPSLKHTQSLHLMSGELSNLRRAILPITSIINTLRDLSKTDDILGHELGSKSSQKNSKIQNELISQTAEIYFADIVDHTLMFTDEIEGMTNNIDNLIGLIFNTISTSTNNSMKQLSLVTVIFLPLSFWTGYYGMNFESFGDLEHNVSYYWKIAIPFSVGLIILLTWNIVKVYLVKVQRFVSDFALNVPRKFKKPPKRRHRKKRDHRRTIIFNKKSNIV